MAGFHKKRRRPGPSKNEEKVSRGKEDERRSHPSNWLGNRFASAEGLSFRLQLIGTHGETLGEEARKFGREDGCSFVVACPGLCGGGNFDLGPKISELIAAREPAADLTLVCENKTYSGTATACGVTLKGRVEIAYRPAAV